MRIEWGYSDSNFNAGEILILEDRLNVTEVTKLKIGVHVVGLLTFINNDFSLANSTAEHRY